VARSEVFDDKGNLIARHSLMSAPVPMILTCPVCGERHIDKGDFETRPHHTHACQHCGMVWRPALVATVGVQFLPGFKD
jgi:rubredoxin